MKNIDLEMQFEIFKKCKFQFSEEARKELVKAQFTETLLRDKILKAKRIVMELPDIMLIQGERAFKTKVEILSDNVVLVHSIRFNKFIFLITDVFHSKKKT